MSRVRPDIPCYAADTCTLSIRVPQTVCGCRPDDRPAGVLWIRRFGETGWLVCYPVFEQLVTGELDFRLDAVFLMSAPGLYEARYVTTLTLQGTPLDTVDDVMREDYRRWCQPAIGTTRVNPHGDLLFGGAVPAMQVLAGPPASAPPHFYLKLGDPRISWDQAQLVHQQNCGCDQTKPEGATNMYDHLLGLCAPITAGINKGDIMLPLSPAAKDLLCGTVICKPVELVLYDGINREVVTFSGCSTTGEVMVDRGNPSYKFPTGAQLKFDWTTANVTNAMEGC